MANKRKSRLSLAWFLLGFLLAAILDLAAVPLCLGSSTREARTAEGEQMLGSAKGQARVAYARSQVREPARLTGSFESGGARVEPPELKGKYYMVLDLISPRGDKNAAMFAIPIRRKTPAVIMCEFAWSGGDGKFTHSYGGGR